MFLYVYTPSACLFQVKNLLIALVTLKYVSMKIKLELCLSAYSHNFSVCFGLHLYVLFVTASTQMEFAEVDFALTLEWRYNFTFETSFSILSSTYGDVFMGLERNNPPPPHLPVRRNTTHRGRR
jgi:hypothetical protein